MKLPDARKSVLTVGAGRGFVAKGPSELVVITAAHCLPFFPPSISFSGLEERTYKSLLGPLNAEPTVWAECLFVDPIGDMAVLGAPDGQELPEENRAFEALLEEAVALRIRGCPTKSPAWLLSLDGRAQPAI